MEITIKESSIVGPARVTPSGSIWLSNLDLLMARFHLPTVYFYKPNGNGFDTRKLKEGLSQILVPFYPVAGRLGYDQSGRLEIVCNAEGVLFVEAETSSVMDPFIADYSDNSPVPRLVPKVDYSGGISSYPLIVLQVTTFKCGGVSLGVGFQHNLADGSSAIHFINSWASTVRGIMSPACIIEPYSDRTLLRARVPPTPPFHHFEYDPSPSMSKAMAPEHYESVVSIFKLTADQLKTLKSKLPNVEDSNSTKYSTFTILTAHLWRSVTKARRLPNDQAIKLDIPVDGRSRLSPPLPPGIFGNVIFYATRVVQAGDLQSESFMDTVRSIHERLKKLNDEYLRSALDCIEKALPDLSSLEHGPHTYRCPNLLINSWMWLPIYDADFGSGRPVYMGPANVVLEGIMAVLPSPTGDGSLSVVTRLGKSYLKLFEKLLYEF